jgi:hypothetical protein
MHHGKQGTRGRVEGIERVSSCADQESDDSSWSLSVLIERLFLCCCSKEMME